MKAHPRTALVVGAGVSGLTTAAVLLRRGWQVRLVTREMPLETTSAVAPAIWHPFRAYPLERVLSLARRTYEHFASMAVEAVPGVRMGHLFELARSPVEAPWWEAALPREAWRPLRPDEMPSPFVGGWMVTVPHIETPDYLPWLLALVQALGGTIEQATLSSLEELEGEAHLIVNCSGVGARTLVGDTRVFPIRGQIVRVERPPMLNATWLDTDNPAGLTYVVPRRADCVLGGTAEEGAWERMADDETTEAILARARALVPALEGMAMLGTAVGLRPGRDMLRLERESLSARTIVVHNYGHGGAGYTLSWAAAEEVATLAEQP